MKSPILREVGGKMIVVNADSPEFWAEYAALISGKITPPAKSEKVIPGSLEDICGDYLRCEAFTSLAPNTQQQYRWLIIRLCAEHGDKDARLLTVETDDSTPGMRVKALANALSHNNPDLTNQFIKILRVVFKQAIARRKVTSNPAKAADCEYYSREGKPGHPIWPKSEVAKFRARHPYGTRPRLAFELLICTAMRRSDVIRVGPKNVTEDGYLDFVPTKNAKNKPSRVVVPIRPELRQALNTPITLSIDGRDPWDPMAHETFFPKQWGGGSYGLGHKSACAFSRAFRGWCRLAGIPDQYTPHGLRHFALTELAEAGATPFHVKAVAGHRNLQSSKVYTDRADLKLLATQAFAKLGGQIGAENVPTNVVPLKVGTKS